MYYFFQAIYIIISFGYICIMDRLKKVLKQRGKTQKWLASEIGISQQALQLRAKNPTYNSMREISDIIGCEIHELFETSEEYSHWYEDSSWLGIRKKSI